MVSSAAWACIVKLRSDDDAPSPTHSSDGLKSISVGSCFAMRSSAITCEKESEVRSENDSEEEETYLREDGVDQVLLGLLASSAISPSALSAAARAPSEPPPPACSGTRRGSSHPCEKESEVRSENDSEEEETYLYLETTMMPSAMMRSTVMDSDSLSTVDS